MIELAVTGASGRMGSKIIKNILEQDDMQLIAAIEAPNTPFVGRDVGEVIGAGNIGVEIDSANELHQVLNLLYSLELLVWHLQQLATCQN